MEVPSNRMLEALSSLGRHSSLYRARVGEFICSAVWRGSSAMGDHGQWYAESMIFHETLSQDADGAWMVATKIVWSGDGWSAFQTVTGFRESQKIRDFLDQLKAEEESDG